MAERDVKSSPGNTISLEETLKAIMPDGKLSAKLPPVESWNPTHCGDIDVVIRADGSWWHEGGRMNRILRKDEDGVTYLVTPYEKVAVEVEDAPFIAVRVDRAGAPGPDQALAFLTNVGDVAVASADLPLRVETDSETGEPAPYVRVRGRLDAKLARPVFYELAGMAVANPDGSDTLGVWSQGVFFPIGAAA